MPRIFNRRIGALSPVGACKSFDQDADGFARAEGVCAVFLQKCKDAKRVYATVVHTKVNCDGFKAGGINYPSADMQAQMMQELYSEIDIPVGQVRYIETHGTG